MTIVYRPETEPVATRLEYWLHAVRQTLGPVALGPPKGATTPRQLLVGDIGALRFTESTIDWADPNAFCQSSRTSRLIRMSDSDPRRYRIELPARGQMVVDQGGRQARLRPGDLTLVDMSRPARWITSGPPFLGRGSAEAPARVSRNAKFLAVTIPHALVPLRPDDVARLTAVRIPGHQGGGALISSFARQLPKHTDGLGATERARLGTAVVDLLTVALAARLDRERDVPHDTHRGALLLRVQGFCEERLGDPDLSPAMIADAHHISLRYLHKLFEMQGQSVAEWIRGRRLERCRRDLLDPALQSRTVGAIGARWGLTNAAHLSRVFRAAYGVPPGEFRSRAFAAISR